MRRIVLAVQMMLLCLLLCACGGGDDTMQQALDLRGEILRAGGCSFSAEIAANLGEDAYVFAMDCVFSPDTGADMTLTAPAEIAGLTAHSATDGITLSFDNTLLDLGDLAAGKVSALTGPALAAGSWTQDYIRDAGRDGGLTRFTCLKGFDTDELQIDTWLDEDGVPCRCEVSSGGILILSMQITNFACPPAG